MPRKNNRKIERSEWIGFCRAIMPQLEEIAKIMKQHGINDISISFSEDYRSVSYYVGNEDGKMEELWEMTHYEECDHYDIGEMRDKIFGMNVITIPAEEAGNGGL